jgi:hypothetical protein
MSNKIKSRHRLVDIGLVICGAFLSTALQTKSIGYGIAGIVIGGLTLWIDNRNVEDEQHEIDDAIRKNNDQTKKTWC